MTDVQLMQTVMSFIGTFGFALVFGMKGRQVLFAGLGGVICWVTYALVFNQVEEVFWACYASALVVAIYSEIMARVNKAPSTVFMVASAIPLIPGLYLYNLMFSLIRGDYVVARQNGIAAFAVAVAIALGFLSIAILTRYLYRLSYFRRS